MRQSPTSALSAPSTSAATHAGPGTHPAADAGINSQLALEVYHNHSSHGGLNLYARQPEAFSYRDDLAELFASHAAVAMGRLRAGVHPTCSHTRKTIGQALGILMSRYDLSEERAFAALVRISQTATGNARRRPGHRRGARAALQRLTLRAPPSASAW